MNSTIRLLTPKPAPNIRRAQGTTPLQKVTFGTEQAKTFVGILEERIYVRPSYYRKASESMEELELFGWESLFQDLRNETRTTLQGLDHAYPAALNFLAANGWKVWLEPYLFSDNIEHKGQPLVSMQDKRLVLSNIVVPVLRGHIYRDFSKDKKDYYKDKIFCCRHEQYNISRQETLRALATVINRLGQPHPGWMGKLFGFRQKFSDSPEFHRALANYKNSVPPIERRQNLDSETLLIEAMTNVMLHPKKENKSDLEAYAHNLLAKLSYR